MENHFYLGIDLDHQNAIVSVYQLNRKEPETVSTVAGSERFQIPVLIAKNTGTGQWCIGEDAKKLEDAGGGRAVYGLLDMALRRDTVTLEQECYPARELLCLFIKKLMFLAGSLGKPVIPDKLVLSLEKISREVTELFFEMAPALGLTQQQITLIDKKESFYYFAYSQKESLYLHDVCLFDYREGKVCCYRMERNLRTTPQLITLTEDAAEIKEMERDQAFYRIASTFMNGYSITTVYLVGDGFEGSWMKTSLSYLCQGRRVFLGKNLYSKGACYAAAIKERMTYWPFVYMGDSEMKVNVSLKVYNRGKLEFFTLISAGDNWYETVGECEVILSGTPEIDFWLQLPNSREAKIEKLELSDFPKRPDKVTRLRITAKPLSDSKVQIMLKDLGFGEIFKSSDQVWEYTMSL